jgi:D-3-phosphoglycerate dehydrogenase
LTLPDLVAVARVAVDIRSIDVEAASATACSSRRRAAVGTGGERAGHRPDARRRRGISRADAAWAGRAQGGMGRRLAGATAGIVDGPLGKRVAELALAFGMTVLVHDPYVTVEHGDIEQVELEELLKRADFVLPLAVATEETENLIGAAQLQLMRRDAYLINLSRGNLIDEAALVAALDEKRIAGAPGRRPRPDQMPSPQLAPRRRGRHAAHGRLAAAIEGQALRRGQSADRRHVPGTSMPPAQRLNASPRRVPEAPAARAISCAQIMPRRLCTAPGWT